MKQLAGNWCDQKAQTRSVLRGAASSARSPKVSSVRYVPGDQQEVALPSHCCSGRRWRKKGAPRLRCYPRRNRGFGLEEKQKNATKIRHRRDSRTLLQATSRTPFVKLLGGDTECPL